MSFQELKAKSFEDADKDNLVKLLNLIHTKIAGLDGKEAFEYFTLMRWAQHVLLPKVQDHIMGEPKVVEGELPEESE